MKTALLAALEVRANARGLVLVNEAALAEQLRCPTSVLRVELAALDASGEIGLLTPPPFLVLRLRKWSGQNQNGSKTLKKAAVPEHRGHSYSFNKQSIGKSKAIAGVDRGLGEGEGLLAEILTTLGESNPATFRGVLEHYPRAVIHTALRRVRATPPEKLRKSRTALFRYLLARSK